MRQVDLDELTYQIFSGLRCWTVSTRRRIFAPIAKREDVDVTIACEALAEKLRIWSFIDSIRPDAPLSLKEVSAVFEAEALRFPGAIADLWMSGIRDREREAQSAAAILLAGALGRLEILSPTTLVHHGARMVRFSLREAPEYAFLPRWP